MNINVCGTSKKSFFYRFLNTIFLPLICVILPMICAAEGVPGEQEASELMGKVVEKVKEGLAQDSSMIRAKEHLLQVQKEFQKLKTCLKEADIDLQEVQYETQDNSSQVETETGYVLDGAILKKKTKTYPEIKVLHPKPWVRDTISSLFERLANYNKQNHDLFGKFWLDDITNKRVLIHTSQKAIGSIDLSPEYEKMFLEILNQLPNANELRIVTYTYYLPTTGESMGPRYAWAGYDEELKYFYGISMPFMTMPKAMDLMKKNSEEAIHGTKREKDLFLGLSIIILILLLLSLTISLRRTKIKNRSLNTLNNQLTAVLVEKNKFLQAAENASCYIVLVDQENTIRWANTKFKELYSNGDTILGTDFFNISSYEKEKLKTQVRLMRNAVEDEDKRFSYRSELGGKIMQSELAVLNAEHTKDWLVLIDTDVTDLEQARRKQMNLFHAASHDIKTPLLGPYTIAEKILHEAPPNFKYREGIEKILTGITNSFDIVKNFKDSSQYEIGNIKFSAESLKLYEMVDKARRVHQTYLKVSQVELINRVNEELIMTGDKIRMESIINNLISNAVKAIKNRRIRTNQRGFLGKVVVNAEAIDRYLLLTVEDNGEGMNETRAKNLFTGATIKKGLGTYLIKSFVQDHGRDLKIRVNSTLKVGTTISIQLPK